MPKILRRDVAKQDIRDLATHIARNRLSAALKFVDAVEEAFRLLATFPEMGTPCEFRSPATEGLRLCTIKRFKKHLILYRPIEDGIEVVRVLYGTRDLEAIFADLPPISDA